MEKEHKIHNQVVVFTLYEDEMQAHIEEAQRGSLNARLNLISHNQRIIDSKLDKVLKLLEKKK